MLNVLKATHDFRSQLLLYVSSTSKEALSQEDFFKRLEKLNAYEPLNSLSLENFKALEELALQMADYSRDADKFSGENNETGNEYNRTLSTLNVIQAIASKNFPNLKSDDINHKKISAPDQFYYLLIIKNKSKPLLFAIKDIINKDLFWDCRSLTGITGIKKMKNLLKNKDLNQLSDHEAINLFNQIIEIAKDRLKKHGKPFLFFWGKRNADVQCFYEAIVEEAQSPGPSEKLLAIENKTKQDHATITL